MKLVNYDKAKEDVENAFNGSIAGSTTKAVFEELLDRNLFNDNRAILIWTDGSSIEADIFDSVEKAREMMQSEFKELEGKDDENSYCGDDDAYAFIAPYGDKDTWKIVKI